MENLKPLIEKMGSAVKEVSTVNGVTTKVLLCQSLCTVEISTKIENYTKEFETLLSRINNDQALCRYSIRDNFLVLDSTLWVDRSPTKEAIKEISDFLLCEFETVRMLLYACGGGDLH